MKIRAAGRMIAGGLSLAAVAALGPSSLEAAPRPSHHKAVGSVAHTSARAHSPEATRLLSPEEARLAIALGTTCSLGAIEHAYTFFNPASNSETTNVELRVNATQTPDSQAARKQYWLDNRVLWSEKTVTSKAFQQQAGRFIDAHLHTTMIGGREENSESSIFVSTAAAKAGDVFGIYIVENVKTAEGQTVTQTPCGAIEQVDDHWQTTAALPLASSIAELN